MVKKTTKTDDKQQLLEKLKATEDADKKVVILNKLSEYKDRRILDEILKLARNDKDDVRESVVEILALYDADEARAALRRALQDKASFVKMKAAAGLGAQMDSTSIEYIGKMMKDKDELVRLEAVEALGLIGDVEAEKYLLKAMRDDTGALVRGHAAEALAKIKSKNASAAISEKLVTEHQGHARLRMLGALYGLGNKAVLPEIIKFLKSKSFRLRCVAVNKLSDIVTKSNRDVIFEEMNKLKKVEQSPAVKSAIKNFFAEAPTK